MRRAEQLIGYDNANIISKRLLRRVESNAGRNDCEICVGLYLCKLLCGITDKVEICACGSSLLLGNSAA